MINLSGYSIGRYQLIEPLGEGGMAVVYKAYDTTLECDVAVKIIRTENLPQSGITHALKRFEREAKAVARLTHSNIVKITDYGNYEDKPYLVMEYLSGGTLKNLIRQRGQIPWQEAAEILLPIADALEYAHENRLVHRDIKPANILLTTKGVAMLTDFGIAKIIDQETTQDLTGTSATVGTPEYMAPEQITSKTVDNRADLYALGVVFYEMITGRRPFEADTPLAVLVKHAHDPLPRASQFLKDLPEDVERFLIKALAKDPKQRFQSAYEMGNAFKNLIHQKNITETPIKPLESISPAYQYKLQRKKTIMIWLSPLVIIFAIGSYYLGKSSSDIKARIPFFINGSNNSDSTDSPGNQPTSITIPTESAYTSYSSNIEFHCTMQDSENETQPEYYDLTSGTIDYINGMLTVGFVLRGSLPDPFPTNYSKEVDWVQLNQWALWIDRDGNNQTGREIRPSYDDRSEKATGIEYEVSLTNYKDPEKLDDFLPLEQAFEGKVLKWTGNQGEYMSHTQVILNENHITLSVPFASITENSKFYFTSTCSNSLCDLDGNPNTVENNFDTAYEVSCEVSKTAEEIPVLLSPENNAQMISYPRKIAFEWTPIDGALRYQIQIDCYNCCTEGKWCSEVNEDFLETYYTEQTKFTIGNWVGANKGRWRVAAITGELPLFYTDWSYFECLR